MNLIIREEFVCRLNLKPGKYQYYYKVNGKREYDENEPAKDNTFGGKDNEIRFS